MSHDIADPTARAREAIEDGVSVIMRNAFITGYLASRPNVSREVIAGMADEYVSGMLEARRQLANGQAAEAAIVSPSLRLLS